MTAPKPISISAIPSDSLHRSCPKKNLHLQSDLRILQRECDADYFGMTVQIISHVTNEIKKLYAVGEDVDIMITEIGVTTGDIDGFLLFEALRQIALKHDQKNIKFGHVILILFLREIEQLKTKPIQRSVAKFPEISIQPDIITGRTDILISDETCQKISSFCNTPTKSGIEKLDLKVSIYELPLFLHFEKLGDIVCQKLHIQT
jgi:CTP synthase